MATINGNRNPVLADGTATTSSPPTVISFDAERIPSQLAGSRKFVGWRWNHTIRNGKKPWTKVPVNPHTGRNASVDDPSTWGTLEDAIRATRRFAGVVGVGYVFTDDDPYAGLDQDGCRDPVTGTITAEATALVERFGSYTEPSVTGTGLHTIMQAPLPPGGNRKGSIEVYATKRFFAMTGAPLPGYETITDRAAELAAWHRETFPLPPPRPKAATCGFDAASASPDDRNVLDRCRRSPKFERLFAGDLTDYGDDWSAADLALLDLFVRAGANDPDQLDRLHRQSGLTRPKWDERRGALTYGERTIARALDGTVVPFTPAPRRPAPNPQLAESVPLAATGTDDAIAALPDDVIALKAMIVALTRRVEAAERRAADAERRADRLSELQSKTVGILGNAKLGQERMTAVALAYEFGNREAAGDAGENGLYPIPLARIAERAGCSEDAASRHIKKLLEHGVIRKELRTIPERIDQSTGEIVPLQRRQYIGPPGSAATFIDTVANLVPTEPKKWGGAPVCRDHPHAGTIKRVTLHCAECGVQLGDPTETYQPPAPNPQVAESVPEDRVVSVATAERTPRVDTFLDAAPRGFGAPPPVFADAPPGSVAQAWLSGAEPPPLDRWTS